ncbi:MAG: hypothetical protein RSG96_04610 [Clostridia bacterium]
MKTAACLRAHLSAWFHSPRTFLMGLFILCLTYMLTRSYEHTLLTLGYHAHFMESIFYHLHMGFNMTMTSAVLLIMVSEVPKRISFQNYMLIRTSRVKWLFSQILFCVAVVLLMLFLITSFSALLTLPYVTPGEGWSDLERLALNKNYLYEQQLVPLYIHSINPLQACLYATAILFFFWLTMVLVILLCSILGQPNLGLILYIFIILSPRSIRYEAFPWLKTPMHFSTLGAIAAQFPKHEIAAAFYTVFIFLLIDVTLIAVMILHIGHADLCFSGKE